MSNINITECPGCYIDNECSQCKFARDNVLPEGTLKKDNFDDYCELEYIFELPISEKDQYIEFKIFVDNALEDHHEDAPSYLKNIFLTFKHELFNAENKNYFMVVYLVECGLDVNSSNRNLWSLLRFAEFYEKFDLAKRLIEKGADVNSIDYSGVSILYSAACIDQNYIITELLLKNGANPNISLYKINTVLHGIIRKTGWQWRDGIKNLISLLLKYGGDPYLVDYEGRTTIDFCNVVNPRNKEVYQELVNEYSSVMDIKEPSVE